MKYILFILVFVSISFSKEISVGVGLSLAPYIFPKNNSGIELDILKKALNQEGKYTLDVKYLPLVRIPYALKNKKIDAATTINEDSGIKNIYYSNTHIVYQNVIVTLKSKHLSIKKIEDLKGLKVVSFQNAANYLGEKYKSTIQKIKHYQELADQELQVKLLFAHRVDAIVLDINIFKYMKKHIKGIDTNQEVSVAQVFDKTYYKIAFIDKKIRDDFNKGLEIIRQNGQYDNILNKYIK